MSTITIDEVRAIIPTTIPDEDMVHFIEFADAMMDVLRETDLPPKIMKEINRWMTAHLIASSRERQAREEGAGGAYIKYTGMSYTGLRGTTYGQQAIALDTTGTLNTIAGKAAKMWVIKEGK